MRKVSASLPRPRVICGFVQILFQATSYNPVYEQPPQISKQPPATSANDRENKRILRGANTVRREDEEKHRNRPGHSKNPDSSVTSKPNRLRFQMTHRIVRCLTSALSGPREALAGRRRRNNFRRACGATRQTCPGPLQRVVRQHSGTSCDEVCPGSGAARPWRYGTPGQYARRKQKGRC